MQLIKRGLNNNQLKIIALISMTIDHIAKYFFPTSVLLLVLGRIAFPIFAYMIAEGCKYTKSINKYLLRMSLFAIVCQLGYSIIYKSLYMSILVTFTFSILLILLYKKAIEKAKAIYYLFFVVVLLVITFICVVLSKYFYGLVIDYGIVGVLMPLCIYIIGKNKWYKIGVLAICLVFLGLILKNYQWFAFLAIPFLCLYNETRGKLNLKYLFYIYYPLHLVVIGLISMIIQKT